MSLKIHYIQYIKADIPKEKIVILSWNEWTITDKDCEDVKKL